MSQDRINSVFTEFDSIDPRVEREPKDLPKDLPKNGVHQSMLLID
jgi:hypothetical protein